MNTELFHIISKIKECKEYQEILTTSEKKHLKNLPILITGLSEGAGFAFYSSLIEDKKGKGPALMIVPSEKEAYRLVAGLNDFGITALFYNVRDFVFRQINSSHEFEQSRIATLYSITTNSCDVVITTPDALMQYTIPKDYLLQNCIEISSDGNYDISDLCFCLTKCGYKYAETVDAPGQFSRRGGILDVYPPGLSSPVRIEFFDTEIDRMSYFDIISQRREEDIDRIDILPVREVLISPDKNVLLLDHIVSCMKKSKGKVRDDLYAESSAVRDGRDLLCIDKYIGLLYDSKTSLLDYFDEDSLLILQNYPATSERAKFFETQINEEVLSLQKEGLISAPYNEFFMKFSLFDSIVRNRRSFIVNQYTVSLSGVDLLGMFSFFSKGNVSNFDVNEMFWEDVENYKNLGYSITFACDSEIAAQNLKQAAIDMDMFDFNSMQVVCSPSIIGFDLPHLKLAVMTLNKGSSVRSPKKSNKKRYKKLPSEKIISYSDLVIGDFVVHENHGIGLYKGIESMSVAGIRKDYVKLQYAGSDVLYLPCDQLDKLSKYIGANENSAVKLSKMGGYDWKKTKSKVKSATKEMAKELINLYAARLRKKGFAFSEDDAMTKEFADSFEYEETPGQLQAISEISMDMQSNAPMDRLLCGDVGYGKTEVAFRAAFKAVMDGKQVAILVPTTILAMQHYQTLQSRMRGFPIKSEMISRFRTAKQQSKILRELARGEVDIIVGTHRILSKDVKFKDLGLLIIDEEQRFGVAQKESLKAIAENVDTLVLTATPIPRTLNMAMSGIRDMSVLEEAPGDRFPVQTFVMEYDFPMITEAIRRELRRGGQVFYLCNDIGKFPTIAQKLSLEFPDARIEIGTGQMEKDELSEVWQSMVQGDADILICTTIIETGVDVPNANTIIIENADRMGLSQLHQIRGRVGRSNRRAYAYFTYPSGKVLNEVQSKRLDALRDFTEFGAGFKIAMRDLEIRGAGNILGAQQHGHLISVGYEMYMRLLSEAILEEKGEKPKENVECVVDISLDAYIPESYIESASSRIDAYRKISMINNYEDMLDVSDELIDRYGDMPKPVSNLLNISLVRSLGVLCGISKILGKSGTVLYYPKLMDQQLWLELAKRNNGKYLTSLTSVPYVQEKVGGSDKVLQNIIKTLSEYLKVLNKDT